MANERYQDTKTHIDHSAGERFGPWVPPVINMDEYELTRMTEPFQKRLDILANEHYGDPTLWWVICQVNNIRNPFDIPVGTELKLPTAAAVSAALTATEEGSFGN
jgi:hypothetical protein